MDTARNGDGDDPPLDLPPSLINVDFGESGSSKDAREAGSYRDDMLARSQRTLGSNQEDSELRVRSKRREEELKLVIDDTSAVQNRRALENLDSLTINKLNTSSLGLIGREKEASILRSAVHRVMEPKETSDDSSSSRYNHKEVVLIHGFSGVGKSALAKGLEKDFAKTCPKGVFVEGKFSLNSSDEPLSAVADAFGQIFSKITGSSSDLLVQVAQRLTEAMQNDVRMMTDLIPELGKFMTEYNPSDGESSDASNEAGLAPEKGQQRWNYAFRVMTRILTESVSPIVIVLDDLQWADVSSLAVMELLLSDVGNPNPVMIVGCYRSDEVDENSVLFNKMASLKAKSDSFRFGMTEIEVGSLGVEQVNQMIMAILSIDDEDKTRDLATVCFKRTEGNPYFLVEFMQMLQQKKFLEFNLGLLRWQWDVSRIEDATMSTPNVVSLLQSRMRKLSDEMQQLQQYAACLGASFDQSTLQMIWDQQGTSGSTSTDTETVSNLLEEALNENLLEKTTDAGFRWVHDKVQEAALSLSGTVNDLFRFEIGKTLLYGMSPSEVDNNLFDIVDLINYGKTNRQAEFAELNLKAVKKARKMSAFQSAARFAAHGIDFLPPEDKWGMHRRLSLDLYGAGAEMEFVLGNVEASERYVECVLNLKNVTFMESLPFRQLKAKRLHDQLKYDETIDYCLSLSRQLGYRVIWSKKTVTVQALRSLHRSIKSLKQKPADFYLTTPKMKDPKDLAIVQVLEAIHFACLLSEKPFLMFACTSQLADLTMQRGIHQYSGYGIVSMAVAAKAIFKDYEASRRLAEMALGLEDHFKGSRAASVIGTAYLYVLSCSIPLQLCYKPSLDGYLLAMKAGDVEWAAWNLVLYYQFLPYGMGKSLDFMVAEYPRVLSQIEEFAQTAQGLVVRIMWQMMIDLQGCHKGIKSYMNGEVFTSAHDREEGVHVFMKPFAKGELLLFSSNYELAAERALTDKDKFLKGSLESFLVMLETFHRGVSLYAMAIQTRKRKYITAAASIRKQVGKWMKQGNPTVVYYYDFLCAEHFALNKKNPKAEEKYQKAIIFAGRSGFLHHAALFNERYADFLVRCKRDSDEIEHRLKESIRFYEEWGAMGKVKQLRKRLEDELSIV